MIVNRKLLFFIVLAAVLWQMPSAFAHDCAVRLLKGEDAPIRWDFIRAEFEAKFLSDKGTLKKMEGLVGEEIEFFMLDGSLVRFKVDVDREYIYEDIYYDTDDLRLYKAGGLLRLRSRWDRK